MSRSAGIIILGGSGHARDIASVCQAAAGERTGVLGYVSPEPGDQEAWARLGIPWLGVDAELTSMKSNTHYLIGIGDGRIRQRLDATATAAGLMPATVVHPRAYLGPDVVLSPGVVIFPDVVLTTNVRIGRHSHVNVAASLSHDCRLGDFVTINPGARLCGWVEVGGGSMIGAGAVVNERVCVGAGAVVGSGSVVIKSVRDRVTVVGVPAHEIRHTSTPPNV